MICLFPTEPAGDATLGFGSFGLDFAVYLVDLLHGGLSGFFTVLLGVFLVLVEFSFGFGEFGAGFVGLWVGRRDQFGGYDIEAMKGVWGGDDIRWWGSGN